MKNSAGVFVLQVDQQGAVCAGLLRGLTCRNVSPANVSHVFIEVHHKVTVKVKLNEM